MTGKLFNRGGLQYVSVIVSARLSLNDVLVD